MSRGPVTLDDITGLQGRASSAVTDWAARLSALTQSEPTPGPTPGPAAVERPVVSPPKALTARERELVTLLARGYTDAQIAAELFISVRTVGSHLDRIRDKTGCRRRADLTRLALQTGLI